MGDAQIQVRQLSKVYQTPQREAGLWAAARSLGRKTYCDVPAVQQIDFDIAAGEMVGFIGPNGAGKTTTLKMLAGLLRPSAGAAQVAGFNPWDRKPAYLRRIAMVLGNKSQLLWDIPALDTFRVLGEIYHVPPAELQATLAELVEMLQLEDLLRRPVRNLSLGERMKCELVAALLHRPAILFLDEPTLGLDVSMQRRLRKFIGAYNRRYGATIILTSHYMADVTELCERVILIHHGRVIYDGRLAELSARLAPFKLLRLALKEPPAVDLPPEAFVVDQANGALTLRVRRAQVPAITARLLNTLAVVDLTIEDPPLEAVIDQIYQEGGV